MWFDSGDQLFVLAHNIHQPRVTGLVVPENLFWVFYWVLHEDRTCWGHHPFFVKYKALRSTRESWISPAVGPLIWLERALLEDLCRGKKHEISDQWPGFSSNSKTGLVESKRTEARHSLEVVWFDLWLQLGSSISRVHGLMSLTKLKTLKLDGCSQRRQIFSRGFLSQLSLISLRGHNIHMWLQPLPKALLGVSYKLRFPDLDATGCFSSHVCSVLVAQ
jgi:hypothetical protein